MIGPARIAAFDILSEVGEGRSSLGSAIAHRRASLKDDRDRALATKIATGVQRWRAALDHLIVCFSKRSIERLDPEIVDILRLSAYQLLYLARVPAAAVVDDGVDLARRAGKQHASGFVNAVLRTISRNSQSLPWPARPANSADREAVLDYFSVTLSHPRWLATRWYDRLGFDAAEAWMRFNNAAAPLTLRANRVRKSPSELTVELAGCGVDVRPGRFAPDALIVDKGRPLRDPGLETGWFVVQDEASQLVSLLAGARPGRRVLDACASPGGKTTAIATAMEKDGFVAACDVRDRRIELLRHTVDVTGATNVRLVQADLLAPLPFHPAFDSVIVDAPCSGLGTLRRDPDIRWRRHETDLARLAASELTMLRHGAAVVATGGRLVYATCSSEPEENEAIAAAFLATSPGFINVDARDASPLLPSVVVDIRGHLRTMPDRHGLEAFFGAVFERRRL